MFKKLKFISAIVLFLSFGNYFTMESQLQNEINKLKLMNDEFNLMKDELKLMNDEFNLMKDELKYGLKLQHCLRNFTQINNIIKLQYIYSFVIDKKSCEIKINFTIDLNKQIHNIFEKKFSMEFKINNKIYDITFVDQDLLNRIINIFQQIKNLSITDDQQHKNELKQNNDEENFFIILSTFLNFF